MRFEDFISAIVGGYIESFFLSYFLHISESHCQPIFYGLKSFFEFNAFFRVTLDFTKVEDDLGILCQFSWD